MSKDEGVAILKIGEYQLQNLIANRVGFLYLDLRNPSGGANDHALLSGSRPCRADLVLVSVHDAGLKPDAPIVLICENGAKSLVAAETLARNSFINVFVVEGGVQGFQ